MRVEPRDGQLVPWGADVGGGANGWRDAGHGWVQETTGAGGRTPARQRISTPFRSCQWPCAADQTRPSFGVARCRLRITATAMTARMPTTTITRDRTIRCRIWRARSSFCASDRSRRSSRFVGIRPRFRKRFPPAPPLSIGVRPLAVTLCCCAAFRAEGDGWKVRGYSLGVRGNPRSRDHPAQPTETTSSLDQCGLLPLQRTYSPVLRSRSNPSRISSSPNAKSSVPSCEPSTTRAVISCMYGYTSAGNMGR